MIVKNGLVLDEEFHFVKKDLYLAEGKILSEEQYRKKCGNIGESANQNEKEMVLPQEQIVDATGFYVLPGLIDIHVHGCHDRDFCDADVASIADFMAYEASRGVTAVCPTTMTVPEEQLLRVADTTRQYRESVLEKPEYHGKEAAFLGINMEGPFISPAKKGSQELTDIQRPDAGLIHRMQEHSGHAVRLVDYAPEMDGAAEMVEALQQEVVLSVAHSNADYETASAAMKSGVHHVTHLYNAMSPYTHRAPGIVGAASDDPACMVELITDGMHIHPSVVRNTFRIFGSERIVLISDSMRATGMPDGEYEFGGHLVTVRGKKATLPDGTIAASVTNLYDCMVTGVREMGIPLEEAARCASWNPAVSIGAADFYGSIAVGKSADLLLVRPDTLELKSVILRGSILL